MRTLDEFKNAARPARAVRDTTQLHVLAQEAVRMENLTGDPHWDHFLSYLEFALKETRRLLEIQRQKLSDPGLVNDEQIRLLKSNIAQSEARIWTLNEVIELPKKLKEGAQIAKGKLSTQEA
jgi:hypothetical protein